MSKKREQLALALAALCDEVAGGKSQSGKEIRAAIRRAEKRKRNQFRIKP